MFHELRQAHERGIETKPAPTGTAMRHHNRSKYGDRFRAFLYVYRDRMGNLFTSDNVSTQIDQAVTKKARTTRSFGKWLKAQRGQHKVEIIGPLGYKNIADAIETALIPSLRADATARLKRSFTFLRKKSSNRPLWPTCSL